MTLPKQLETRRQVRELGTSELTIRDAGENTESGGFIGGIANRMGDLDSWDTVVDPESVTQEMLTAWVDGGAFLGGHAGSATPIGMILEATISGRDIVFEAEYHTTRRAQEYYLVAKERRAKGKAIGMSLGFDVAEYEYFPTGARMIEALRGRGRDLSKFNVDQLMAHTRECWLMTIEKIWEVSQVNFQANAASEATSVRCKVEGENDEQGEDKEEVAKRQARTKAMFEAHDLVLGKRRR